MKKSTTKKGYRKLYGSSKRSARKKPGLLEIIAGKIFNHILQSVVIGTAQGTLNRAKKIKKRKTPVITVDAEFTVIESKLKP